VIGNGSLEGRFATRPDQFGPTTWVAMPRSVRERKRFVVCAGTLRSVPRIEEKIYFVSQIVCMATLAMWNPIRAFAVPGSGAPARILRNFQIIISRTTHAISPDHEHARFLEVRDSNTVYRYRQSGPRDQVGSAF
jgi:hypothetical protein